LLKSSLNEKLYIIRVGLAKGEGVMIDTITLKAELLCKGVFADSATIELFEMQNPMLVWKTGNNGCFFEFDDTRLLASIAHRNNKMSPYCFYIWFNIFFISSNTTIPEVFLLEGERFFHQAYKGCDYMACGKGCAFCATGVRSNNEVTPREMGEAVGIIKEHIPDAQICLGGGTYLPVSSNVNYFAECVMEIRKRDEYIPIWIEMIPPLKKDIKLLVELGATAFGFNLELWDDEKRELYCPGKSSISKQQYLEALEYAAQVLPNHVGSCLLVGLDTQKNIREGIQCLVNIGVHPCLLPFKPFDGSKLEKNSPCNSKELLELSYYAVEQMHSNRLNLFKNQGCLLCECCTVMHDIYRKKYLEVIWWKLQF